MLLTYKITKLILTALIIGLIISTIVPKAAVITYNYNYSFYDYTVDFHVIQSFITSPLNISIHQTLVGFSIKISNNISPLNITSSKSLSIIISFPYVNFTYESLGSLNYINITSSSQNATILIYLVQNNVSIISNVNHISLTTDNGKTSSNAFTFNSIFLIILIIISIISYTVIEYIKGKNKNK